MKILTRVNLIKLVCAIFTLCQIAFCYFFQASEEGKSDNYRPVSILPNLSKMYIERCMYIQIYEYLNKILSKWQWSFRQGCSAHHSLVVMIEKWRQCLDNGGVSGALLRDIFKSFDFILSDLLIAKLAADGFDYN